MELCPKKFIQHKPWERDRTYHAGARTQTPEQGGRNLETQVRRPRSATQETRSELAARATDHPTCELHEQRTIRISGRPTMRRCWRHTVRHMSNGRYMTMQGGGLRAACRTRNATWPMTGGRLRREKRIMSKSLDWLQRKGGYDAWARRGGQRQQVRKLT